VPDTTIPTTEFLVECLRTANLTGIAERYAPGVLVDMNVPHWRFQLQGRLAAAELAAEEVDRLPNVRATWVRATTTDDALVVEYELQWDGAGGRELSRAVSIFRLEGDRVVERTDYCCGNWTPADIARIKAEAPIVRW